MAGGGAYLIRVRLEAAVLLGVGCLGEVSLPAGVYLYVGSARAGLEGRVGRHRRLCETKAAVRRWHIDGMLAHPETRWLGVQYFPGGEECALSQALAAHPRVSVVCPGFGASDCRAGCISHFYRLNDQQFNVFKY